MEVNSMKNLGTWSFAWISAVAADVRRVRALQSGRHEVDELRGKSEVRNPKSERNPKEIRRTVRLGPGWGVRQKRLFVGRLKLLRPPGCATASAPDQSEPPYVGCYGRRGCQAAGAAVAERLFLHPALRSFVLVVLCGVGQAGALGGAEPLPWEREMPLRDAARTVALESTLHPSNPQPDIYGEPFRGPAMSLNNLKMRSTLWGPPNRITLSLMKNNVWDRRLHEFQARGGFLVSAAKEADGVYHVEIEARRDLRCQLMNPWPGQAVVVHEVGKRETVPVQVDRGNGECLVFAAVTGHKYLLERNSVGLQSVPCAAVSPTAEARPAQGQTRPRNDQFDRTITREVLGNYLARSISVEGVFNGRGDLADNLRLLKSLGVKYAGRSLCLWGAENNFLANLERARQQAPKAIAAAPDLVLEACVFETVSARVEQIAVPDWVLRDLGQPVEKRNFVYTNIIYPVGQRRAMGNAQVPDVSRLETQL